MNKVRTYINYTNKRRDEELLWNFIKEPINKIKIKEKLNECIFTPLVLTKSINRFKVNLKDNAGFEWKGRNKSVIGSHDEWTWAYSNQYYSLEISIEMPIDEQFQLENTIVKISFSIEPPIRKKPYFEMFNKIITTDHEENMNILLKLIEDFGLKVNEDFSKLK